MTSLITTKTYLPQFIDVDSSADDRINAVFIKKAVEKVLNVFNYIIFNDRKVFDNYFQIIRARQLPILNSLKLISELIQ